MQAVADKLAKSGAELGIRAFANRIIKAIKSKGITLAKLLQIYTIVEKAVKDIEAVLAQK